MKAVAVFPASREVKLISRAEPALTSPDELRLQILEVGVCGTDREICHFVLGTPPAHSDNFILGHEMLARVVETGSSVSGFKSGDLVVSAVRRPCTQPECEACSRGYQDFCSTGNYRECGIKELDGFMTEFITVQQEYLFRLPAHLRDVGILLEPLTIAEKAFTEARRIQGRLPWQPEKPKAVVLGAGPVGILGAMKLVDSGFQTFIYSRDSDPDLRMQIAREISAEYISAEAVSIDELPKYVGRIDLVYEVLGAAQVAFDVLRFLSPNGIFLFTGVPRDQELRPLEPYPLLANLVLQNQAIVGVVNAGRQAFTAGVEDLTRFESRWPRAVRSLITHHFPIDSFRLPITGVPGQIKGVIQVTN
jgi:threonine dehydrogenase-like Zn-dependent dehydrogenase